MNLYSYSKDLVKQQSFRRIQSFAGLHGTLRNILSIRSAAECLPSETKYGENGMLRKEKWEPGKGPDGLLFCTYFENGNLQHKRWCPGRGPGGITDLCYHENGMLQSEEWEENISPGGLTYRTYDVDGNLIYESWEYGRGPDKLLSRMYYSSGGLREERWYPVGLDGFEIRKHDENGHITLER